MEPVTIVLVVIVAAFYLRLFLIRRGKRRREKIEMVQRMKMGKKAPPLPPRDPNAPWFSVTWWLVVPAMILMLIGIAMFTQSFLPELKTYWWIPVAVGGILFIVGFK